MKHCPNCGAPMADAAVFCTNCGTNIGAVAPAPIVNPYDHTAEFDPKDISDNKVYCMLIYLMGTIGIIIALLAANDSPFTRFHVRQCVKITVCELLITIVSAVLAITIIVPIVGVICLGVLAVVQIICFVRICKGQAKEAPIVCTLNLLK